jgi:hypothetical protein
LHASRAAISLAGAFIEPPWPYSFTKLNGGSKYGSLVNDAEVGSRTFQTPLPLKWEPSQMDMKSSFPVEVAVDQTPPYIEQPVLVLMPPLLWAVEQALRLFEPVFAGERPPLPVGAIQPFSGRIF